MRRASVVFGTSVLAALLLAGCTQGANDRVLRLAFTQHDDSLEPAKWPERLAEQIQQRTGRPTEIFFVTETEAALESVRAGQSDVAFVDAAAGWFAWERLKLEVAAAHLESDGRPFYVAVAWALQNSTYQKFEDLRGEDSCHTGLLKSAGMFMPLGWMIENGLVTRVGPDEASSIEPTVDAFFGTARIPRSDSDPYGNYQGALRCLSEGLGAVAFGKDTTAETFCGATAKSKAPWCLPIGEYRILQVHGKVPSHPIMVGPDVPADKRADLVRGLVDMSDDADGQAVLQSVLGTKGVVAASSEEHLGEWTKAVRHVPGMATYAVGRLEK